MRAQRLALLTLLVAVFAAPHLEADVVLLKDTSGVASYVVPPYYVGGSGGYALTILNDTIPPIVYVGDPAGNVSDKITSIVTPDPFCEIGNVPQSAAYCEARFSIADFTIQAGLDLGPNPETCTSVGGCDFARNGSIQDVGSVTWGPGLFPPLPGFTTTLEYQYTPEPSGYLALSIGLGAIGAVRLKRKRRNS